MLYTVWIDNNKSEYKSYYVKVSFARHKHLALDRTQTSYSGQDTVGYLKADRFAPGNPWSPDAPVYAKTACGMRRNGVSLFFSLSLFNFRCWPAFFRLACVAGVPFPFPFPFPFERLPRRLFSARLHWPKAFLAQATWREKWYVISAFILHFESPLSDALLPESEQVLQKQKCSGSNF